MKPLRLMFVTVPLFLLACVRPTGTALTTQPPVVVADAGLGGGQEVSFQLTPQRARRLQAMVHRWTASDVVRYYVTLAEVSPSDTAELAGPWYAEAGDLVATGVRDVLDGAPLSIELDPTQLQSRARFVGLPHGKRYRAFVVAEAQNPLDEERSIVNRQQGFLVKDPETAEPLLIDFTADQDVEDDQAIEVQISLDNVLFSGNGDVAIGEVTDGGYTDPTAAPSGSPVAN